MPTTRARTRLALSTSAVAVIATLGLMLTACGGTGKDPNVDPTAATGAPGEQPERSTEPQADWHPAVVDGGKFLVPPDWDVEEGETGPQLQAPRLREGGVRMGGGSLGSQVTIESASAIDDAGDTALAYHENEAMENVERLPDVTFGGVRFYHVRGENDGLWMDDYGTVHNGQLIAVLWLFNRGMVDREQTDDMLDQVMSTFTPTS